MNLGLHTCQCHIKNNSSQLWEWDGFYYFVVRATAGTRCMGMTQVCLVHLGEAIVQQWTSSADVMMMSDRTAIIVYMAEVKGILHFSNLLPWHFFYFNIFVNFVKRLTVTRCYIVKLYLTSIVFVYIWFPGFKFLLKRVNLISTLIITYIYHF